MTEEGAVLFVYTEEKERFRSADVGGCAEVAWRGVCPSSLYSRDARECLLSSCIALLHVK